MASIHDTSKTASSKDATISIEGMTCMSCVKTIENSIGAMYGIHLIRVSLGKKLADVTFNPEILTCERICGAINDMGFEAALSNQEKQHQRAAVSFENHVEIDVNGMTCQSCVKNIEEVVGQKVGVEKIKVSLVDKCAKICYDPGKTNPIKLVSYIDEMGFDANLPNGADISTNQDGSTFQIKITVIGMTCKSCVQNIEGVISEKPGVKKIKVSLENEEAYIEYDEKITNPVSLRDAIDDMGFEASLPNQGKGVEDVKKKASHAKSSLNETALIHIEGMTCNSCVKNIEELISAKVGVHSIKVSLVDKEATITYNPQMTNPQILRNEVDDMGFEANLLDSPDDVEMFDNNLIRNKTALVKCVIGISGMTCTSCSTNIQEIIGEVSGIRNIEVSLAESKAFVKFNSDLISADEIAVRIEEMGFDATVIDHPLLCSVSTLTSRKSTGTHDPFKMSTFIASNDANSSGHEGTSDPLNNLKKCYFKVTGMTCGSCVANVERNVKKLPGVADALVNLMTQKAEIKFNPDRITPEEIGNKITDIGYPSTILEEATAGQGTVEFMIVNMNSILCLHKIETHLTQVRGMVSVTINLTEKIGKFVYETESTGPRNIMEIIENLGFQAELVQDCSRETEKLEHKRTIKKWRNSFLASLLFALPVLAIMIYSWLPCHHNNNQNDTFVTIETPEFPDCEFRVTNGLSLGNLLMLFFCTLSMIFGGRYFFIQAFKALRHCTANMDVLIALATSVAYTYSLLTLVIAVIQQKHYSPVTFFDTPPLLFLFISLGRWLEHIAKDRTSEALTKLMSLKATDARLVTWDERGNIVSEQKINVDLVQRNDLLKILPGEKIPVDGRVVEGSSHVDESMITGESMPVTKRKGSDVIGGSMNKNGNLTIKATHIGGQSALSQIVKLVEEAQTSKAPIQHMADKIAGVFVPIVVSVSIITLAIWLTIGFLRPDIVEKLDQLYGYEGPTHAVIENAFNIAISVLCIACPCALGLATPTAVMVGTGIGATNGILIKGGEPLETTHKVNSIVFDKTGTITRGEPQVSALKVYVKNDRWNLQKLLLILGTSEASSEHPIATAIVKYVKKVLRTETFGKASKFRNKPGYGMKCIVTNIDGMMDSVISDLDILSRSIADAETSIDYCADNTQNVQQPGQSSNKNEVFIGNRDWMEGNGMTVSENMHKDMEQCEVYGHTAVLCAVNGNILCMIAVADTVKSEAHLTVYTLKKMGLDVILLTGDNMKTAKAIAKQVGITTVFAEVLPSHKVEKVKQLQGKDYCVAMVGDGINDTPALAQANVGIAIGTGTAIAVETADLVLIRSDLLDVIAAINLSQKTVSRIRFNFGAATIYNLLAIPLAAGALSPLGWVLSPWMASIAMAFSSVSVVCSSLLLRRWKKPTSDLLSTRAYYKVKDNNLLTSDDEITVYRGLGDGIPRRQGIVESVLDSISSFRSCNSTLRSGILDSLSLSRNTEAGRHRSNIVYVPQDKRRLLNNEHTVTEEGDYGTFDV